MSLLFSLCHRKAPCAEAHRAEHSVPQAGGKSQPGEGRECWSLLRCSVGFWWNTMPWGKSLLSPDPHWGPLWTFHHIKIDLPQTTCTISPGADKAVHSTSVPQLIQQLSVRGRKTSRAVITSLFVISSEVNSSLL